jgi:serine/threonine protein kinase
MTSIGDRIAKQYMLEKEMDGNDMGSSFLARSLNDETRVLVQIIKRPANTNAREELLFSLEKLKALNHPNLATPLATGQTTDGEVFAVTRMEGLALNKLIPKNEGLSLSQAWPFLSQIAEGLSAAHKQGLFHFDLNPMNILVETDEEGDEVVRIRWLMQGNLEMDLANFKALASFILEGKNFGAGALSPLIPMQHFVNIQGVVDALSEIHRKQMIVPPSHENSLSENVVDFSVGRFIVASIVVTLMGCTLLLYYWLTSST